jgi:hypothetical protein
MLGVTMLATQFPPFPGDRAAPKGKVYPRGQGGSF